MADIFLSYSQKDKDRVKCIIDFFEGNKYSVWWDNHIIPGQGWPKSIQEELNKAICVVVVWSHNSINSEWVEIEAGKAKARKVYVPIMIDDVLNDIPLEFSRIEVANFVGFAEQLSNTEADLVLKAIDQIKNKEDDTNLAVPNNQKFSPLYKRNFWNKWQTKISVVAALIGIPLTILNTFTAFKPINTSNVNAAVAQTEENAFHFEFDYISLNGIYDLADTSITDPRLKLHLSNPQIANEIISLYDSLPVIETNATINKTFLLVKNQSKNSVDNVKIELETTFINDTVVIVETSGKLVEDYEQQLQRKAYDHQKVIIKVPGFLEPGAGILIPIYETSRPHKGSLSWIFTSRNVCIPKKLIYRNIYTQKDEEVQIRKLSTPLIFRGGVEVRG